MITSKSRGLLFDVGQAAPLRPLTIDDIKPELVRPGDFIILRTGTMLRNAYASEGYFAEYIEASWELINLLLERKIRFIGLDARGLRQNNEHRQADLLCENNGAYVIENLANTEKLPANRPFCLYAAWFDTGGSGVPCRVCAEIEPD